MRFAYELPPLPNLANAPGVSPRFRPGADAGVSPPHGSGFGDVLVYPGPGVSSVGSVTLTFPSAPPALFVSGGDEFGNVGVVQSTTTVTISWTGATLKANSRPYRLTYQWFDVSGTGPAPTAPVNTVAPSIDQAVIGSVSTCDGGTWTGTTPITLAYQWQINSVDVGGATMATYTPVSGDNTKTLRCRVTATNVEGSTGPVNSNALTVSNGSFIELADSTALYNMLVAGVGASGGKNYRLAAGDYGIFGFYDYHFDSNPILITGQSDASLVQFEWMEWAGSSGITFENVTVYGGNASLSDSAIAVHGDRVTAQNLTFSNVIINNGSPMGTQSHGGWLFRDLVGCTMVINGQNDWTKPDIWGASFGIEVVDCTGASGSITFNGLTAQNIGINAFLANGGQNITINGWAVQDQFWGVGDHPNGIHFFSGTYGPSQNCTITNCGIAQGTSGLGTQCYFFENVINFTLQNNWGVEGAFIYDCSNSAGNTFLFDNNFLQGVTGGPGGGTAITRGGAVDTTVTNNTLCGISNYTGDGVNPGYVPATPPGSNTLIGLTTYGDWTDLNAWRATHPTSRPPPP